MLKTNYRDACTREHRSHGFTLLEIMVVLVIIGLIIAMVAPNVMGGLGKAQTTKAKQDIRSLSTALDLYKLDNYRYPSTDQGLKALVAPPPDAKNWKKGGYLRDGSVPKDPWGFDYHYEYPGSKGGEYDVYTLGADGQEGGEGENADIGNWNLND